MTKLWPDGQAVEVKVNQLGEPITFRWRGQWHPVEHLTTRWRLDEAWWRGEQVWREYFKLTTTTELLLIVYRDLKSGSWALMRLYD